MANAYAPNYVLAAVAHSFSAVWKTTRCMKKAGWTVVAHSDGTTKVSAGSNANDSWGNNADPMADTYPAFNTAAAWIVMERTSTIKVTITVDTIGTFIRGEAVTQAVSGATAEIHGVVFDSVSMTGWAVLIPRTGTFVNGQVITGSTSGATLLPSSTPFALKQQMVFAKSSADVIQGSIFYVCFDSVSETASAFSTLAASAGCTATIPPGCGGTGNTFPTIAYACRGTGGAVTHTYFVHSSTNPGGSARIAAVNSPGSAGVSGDGSFYCCLASATINKNYLFGLMRVDDAEPGDCDPYVWTGPCGQTFAAFSRTARTNFAVNSDGLAGNDFFGNGGYYQWVGNAARTCPVTARDQVVPYFNCLVEGWNAGSQTAAVNIAGASSPQVLNTPAATPPTPCSGWELWSKSVNAIHRKGIPRWLRLFGVGSSYDTIDSKKWFAVFTRDGATLPTMAVGPFDGSTTPVQ